MAGVFISYRREDSPGHAGRIFDRVRARFGADAVFMDVSAIDAGADFVDAIEQAVGGCDVLLAIIGPQWITAADRDGRRRLENPNDFIRLEVAGALKRGVRVVPVLVDGARFPAASDLPDDLQPLLRRNAAELRDARWDADIDLLISSLERIVKRGDGDPWRLEAPPRRRLRTVAALAIVALSVGAAATFGPRACAPAPGRSAVATAAPPTTAQGVSAAAPRPAAPAPEAPAATPKPPAATASDTPPASAGTTAKPTAAVPVPNVVGRTLTDAREILRRAGVAIERTAFVEDRTEAANEVLSQAEMKGKLAGTTAVALTVAARATVVVSHRPEDAELARGLAAALRSSGAAAGLVLRLSETPQVRAEALGRVVYSTADLAVTAADLAKDASTWLRQSDPGRPPLTSGVYERVASRSLVIGVPPAGGPASATAPLPDVRGLTLADARRRLTASGRVSLSVKWFEDRARTPLEVISQTELPASTPGSRAVVLDAVGRGTLVVEYAESDRPAVVRLAGDLRNRLTEGVVLRLRPVDTVRKATLRRVVVSDENLAGEAATIAKSMSSWLTKETGRSTKIPVVTDRLAGPRMILFGLPPLQSP